jgi:ABC-type nitrate/sulfonate/bicarbonate transport system permease component
MHTTVTPLHRIRPLWQRSAWLSSHPSIGRAIVIFVALVLWALSTRLGIVSPVFVSSPVGVVTAAPHLVRVPEVQHAFRVTGQAIAISFVAGTVIGIVAGLAIGLSKLIRDTYFGGIVFILSTPKAIFIPIFLVIFGTAHTAAAFATFEAFFYVTVNVVGGVGLIEDRHRTLVRAFRAPLSHAFRDVYLPASLPGIFAGIWYGIKHAFLAVMIVELYVSAGGLGGVIRRYTNSLETDKVFAMILAISIVAVLVGVAWTRIEKRLTRWRSGADTTMMA